ncbi:STM4504/CBY_0614 family protein [Microbulbifer sediminum]|uniref:STM4504/CBY_0614 family protein n=1 Tax=Microbulbifer sediminum TaxID=2904250 RepID=UPI001F4164C2|nr:hypothetical protein [Microbulbifer sediminum]
MAVIDLYSKRQKALKGEVQDVYLYDEIPQSLRVQITYIWSDTLGNEQDYWLQSEVKEVYRRIVNRLCREYGVYQLPHSRPVRPEDRMYLEELRDFFLEEKDVDRVLDVVEQTFKMMFILPRVYRHKGVDRIRERVRFGIEELNKRFNEHAIGFEFVSGEIVRVDSALIHSEVVKPALRLLSEREYSGSQDEFLKAFEHYRKGNNKEALNDCLKSFESTMIAICNKRGWELPSKITARSLINVCFENGLIPAFWDQHFSSLRSMLESGIPTGRNRLSGHGQGEVPTEVPGYLVAFMLHMTASALVFLAEAERKI